MRVLITRPEPGAGRTAEELRRRGFLPVVMPLSRTVPLNENHLFLETRRAAAYAVTSAAALSHWRPGAPTILRRPIFAVGDATADAARNAGFTDVRIGNGDGAGLASLIFTQCQTGTLVPTRMSPLIYVAGRIRSENFERALVKSQVPFAVTEIYDTEELSYSSDFFLRQFSASAAIATLFYSSNAVRLFFDGLAGTEWSDHAQKCHFLCLSDQIAAALPPPWQSVARVARSPREADLLELLEDVRRTT